MREEMREETRRDEKKKGVERTGWESFMARGAAVGGGWRSRRAHSLTHSLLREDGAGEAGHRVEVAQEAKLRDDVALEKHLERGEHEPGRPSRERRAAT